MVRDVPQNIIFRAPKVLGCFLCPQKWLDLGDSEGSGFSALEGSCVVKPMNPVANHDYQGTPLPWMSFWGIGPLRQFFEAVASK